MESGIQKSNSKWNTPQKYPPQKRGHPNWIAPPGWGWGQPLPLIHRRKLPEDLAVICREYAKRVLCLDANLQKHICSYLYLPPIWRDGKVHWGKNPAAKEYHRKFKNRQFHLQNWDPNAKPPPAKPAHNSWFDSNLSTIVVPANTKND